MALAPTVFYQTTPAMVVNEGIDMLGASGQIIGDLTDGTAVATAARRNYGQAVRQLLRAAHWDFARKRDSLQLLGDSTGASPAPVITTVEPPWTYAYAWPIDGVAGRWLPWSPNSVGAVSGTGVPLTTAPNTGQVQPVLAPARFLVSTSDQYPIETGLVPWDQQPDLRRTFGLGPTNRRVILTDCMQAQFVYTRLVTSIEEWNQDFRKCIAMMMALTVAPAALPDPKVRLPVIDRITKNLQVAIADARVANGNESGMPQSTDHQPNWITARSRGWWGASPAGDGTIFSGYTFYPYDGSMQWGGSVF